MRALFAIFLFALPNAYAQDAAKKVPELPAVTAAPVPATTSAAAPTTTDTTAATADPEPTPAHRRRPLVRNENYDKSRYTSDRSDAEADHRSILLTVGNDKVIDLDPTFKSAVERKETVFVGNDLVARVGMIKIGDQTQLVIKPLAEGETNSIIRDKNGKVRIILTLVVAKQDLVKYTDRLKDRLKEVEGINIGIEDQKIVIRGEVLTPADYGQIINEIADKSYGESVINKATMSNVTLGALAKKIEQDVQVFAPTVRTSVLNGKIIIDGSVDSEGVKGRITKRAQWYLPTIKIADAVTGAANVQTLDDANKEAGKIIQNDIQVTPPPPKRDSKLVRLTIYFVELSKDFLKSFAFKWQPGFTADPSISIGSTTAGSTTATNAGGFTFAGTLSSLFPTFSANPSSSAYGRVMKTETMVIKSESQGHLTNRQNIPTQVVGQNGTTGTGSTVPVGTDLDITPKILQGQDVDLDIDLKETAQIGKGVSGAPITVERGVKTRLYLKSGETAAVAGMNTQDITTTFNRDDPNAQTGTATTKAIFNLERSKNMSKARGQFVVFISPQIIESASEGTEDLKKNFRIPTSNR